MEPTAPNKEQRIAAHRAPNWEDKTRFAGYMITVVWNTNRRLFWGMAFALGGIVAILGFIVALFLTVMF